MLELPRGNLYPVLPLRDIVVFPHMVVPLFVGRERSVKALEQVMKDDRQILLASQKDAAKDDPGSVDDHRHSASPGPVGGDSTPSGVCPLYSITNLKNTY